MINFNSKFPSKGIFETLRERLAELEDLQATDAPTPDDREVLVDLRELLSKLEQFLPEHAGKTLH